MHADCPEAKVEYPHAICVRVSGRTYWNMFESNVRKLRRLYWFMGTLTISKVLLHLYHHIAVYVARISIRLTNKQTHLSFSK